MHIGECRDVMRELIAQGVKVQCVVTSPPYWGLRDYGTGTWEGGDAECDHVKAGKVGSASIDICGKCGARRVDKQLGLEPRHDCGAWTQAEVVSESAVEEEIDASVYDEETGDWLRYEKRRRQRRIRTQRIKQLCGECYVCDMVEVFRLVCKLLDDSGTLWLNLGDSYINGGKGVYQSSRATAKDSKQRSNLANDFIGAPNRRPQPGLKNKDLCMMPARVALALQADGWYLRQDIIWHKPNTMPESVTDRCTKAHEYLFLLTKSERYYFDAEAIKEPSSYTTYARLPGNKTHKGLTAYEQGHIEHRTKAGLVNYAERMRASWKTPDGSVIPVWCNKRSVWTISSERFSGAHFATFPKKLVEPCILAGSRPGDIVFDPFIGSGTVGQVAENLGRQWIGIDLNPEYAKLARVRTAQMVMAL